MQRTKPVLLAVALAGLCACASPHTKDIVIESETPPGADVASVETYAWLGSAQILNDPFGQWEPRGFDADAEIRFLIDREMRRHGLMQVETGPDVLVAYLAGVDMDALELAEDPETKIQFLKSEPQGALMILLLDSSTGHVVWGAKAEGEASGESTAEKARTRLDFAVTRMLAELPRE